MILSICRRDHRPRGSGLFLVVSNAISYHIEPRYNGTRLYSLFGICNKKIIRENIYMFVIYFRIYCVWSTLSHNKSSVFLSRSSRCLLPFILTSITRSTFQIDKSVKIQNLNSELWYNGVLAILSPYYVRSPLYVNRKLLFQHTWKCVSWKHYHNSHLW